MSQNNNLEKHFTASALIIDNGKVLLLHHKKLGVWLYPGGHIEKNETPDQTVAREVKEETGLDIEIIGEKDDNLADADTDVSVLFNPYVVLCELVGNHYHNDIVYLKHIITETNIALKTISELLLMKTELTTEDIEKSLLDLAKDLGSFKKYIEKEYEDVIGKFVSMPIIFLKNSDSSGFLENDRPRVGAII